MNLKLTIAILGVAGVLGGCGQGDAENGSAAADRVTASVTAGVDDAAIAALVEECMACHSRAAHLDEIPDDELGALIRAVAAGDAPHPTQLPELTDEQIEALARAL